MKTLHLVIEGRVQGVGYRYFTRAKAEQVGITGWVRNMHNGNVEAVIAGGDKLVDDFIQVLYQGPALSRIENIIIKEIPSESRFKSFNVLF